MKKQAARDPIEAVGILGAGMNKAMAIIISSIARRTGTTAGILDDLQKANLAFQRKHDTQDHDVIAQNLLQQVIRLLADIASDPNSANPPPIRPNDR